MNFIKNFRTIFVFFALVLITLPFRLYQITYPLLDSANFRQAQTATVAKNFYQKEINLFKTELDIFGIGKERFLTLEFPLYETLVSFFYKLFFFSEVWGKIVSILMGFIASFYLYKLVLLTTKNQKLSLLSALFFLFAPLNMFYQRAFMIESTVIAVLLMGVYYFVEWVGSKSKISYFLSIAFLSLGFIQKGVYGPFWLIPLVVYYLKRNKLTSLFKPSFLLILAIPLVCLSLWQNHVNLINSESGHDYFTSYNQAHLQWNFGTLADRLSWSMWQPRLTQLLNGIFLKPGLVVFLIGLIFFPFFKFAFFLYPWLLSSLLYFITLFRIQSHNYYQMVMIAPISIFMAWGLIKLTNWCGFFLKKLFKLKLDIRLFKSVFISLFITVFIYRSFLHARWSFVVDFAWYKRLIMVGNSLPKESFGILVTPGYDWNSVYTYYPERKMLLVEPEKIFSENITNWQRQGYSFLVVHEPKKVADYLEQKGEGPLSPVLNQYRKVLKLPDFEAFLFN